jgi:small nuclear ribonucleoprotein (snRNP)-like protein
MTRDTFLLLVTMLLLLALAGCAGIRYSEVVPEAKDFHPKRIGVFPVDVGTYEEARGLIDQIIAGVLVDTDWFTNVVSADAINRQMQSSEELRKVFLNYMSKLKAVNYSDADLSRKLGEMIKVDAFLLSNVDYWNYTVEKGDKVAKVVMGVKMIETVSGKTMWTAGHHEVEDYILMKPALPDVAKSLVRRMVKEMPH